MDKVRESDSTKIDSAVKMFWRTISQGIKVDYLLMDSWFIEMPDQHLELAGSSPRPLPLAPVLVALTWSSEAL